MDSRLIEKLAQRLGPNGYSTDAATIAPLVAEWRGRWPGATPFLAMPATTAETADVVRLCAEAGAAITPQGGNTGLVGGQIPQGEILLSLRRMNRIRDVDAAGDFMVAEAGVVLASAHEAAAAAERHFPLSLGSQGSATIGGLISTNAGGVHVLRYGMMRDLVLGLEVVLADGRVLPTDKALRKDNTGYDLKQLFIGAEGTLGVITAATLKLFPKPAARLAAFAALESPDQALALLARAKRAAINLSAFEIMNRQSVSLALKLDGVRSPFTEVPPWMALIECEAGPGQDLSPALEAMLAEALEAGLIFDAAIAQSEAQVADFWRVREMLPAAHRGLGPEVNTDISVPVSSVPAFLQQADEAARILVPDCRIVAFGHAGDGNIHYSVLAAEGAAAADFDPRREAIAAAVYGVAVRLGGSISAEHGIGVARRAELPAYKGPVAMDVMRAVKAALDPQRLFNPRAMV